ncbi:hypothetical protein P4283_29120 [Bacillus thuringiensis]|nr:hypothetical protein [Bacillus thuringiensis]
MLLVPGNREGLDRHKYLLNVENDIVDLKTRKLQQHDWELGLSQIINIAS